MSLPKPSFLESIETNKRELLEQPVLLNWFCSYTQTPILFAWKERIINTPGIQWYYNSWKKLVYAIENIDIETYKMQSQEGKYMLYEDGKLSELPEKMSMVLEQPIFSNRENRLKEVNKAPFIRTNHNGYMKYDENWDKVDLLWLNSNNKITDFLPNKKIVKVNTKPYHTRHILDDQYNITKNKNMPIGAEIIAFPLIDSKQVSEDAKWLCIIKQWWVDSFYHLCFETGVISPLIFSWKSIIDTTLPYEYKKDSISEFYQEVQVIQNGKRYVFGISELPRLTFKREVLPSIPRIEENYDTYSTNIAFSKRNKYDGVMFIKDGSITPFTGLKDEEEVDFEKTREQHKKNPNINAIIVHNKSKNSYEIKTYNNNWEVIEIINPLWTFKTWESITRNWVHNFIWLQHAFTGGYFLLSKDLSSIVTHQGLLITNIDKNKKQITVLSKDFQRTTIWVTDDELSALLEEAGESQTNKEILQEEIANRVTNTLQQ